MSWDGFDPLDAPDAFHCEVCGEECESETATCRICLERDLGLRLLEWEEELLMPEQRATLDNMHGATVRDLIDDLGGSGAGLRLIEGTHRHTSQPVILIVANGYAAALLREVIGELQRMGEAQAVVDEDRRSKN